MAIKEAKAWFKSNLFTSNAISGRTGFFSGKSGKALLRKMAMGSSIGAASGVVDNFSGNDKRSVLGGAMTGAMLGAAYSGVRGMYRMGRSGRGVMAGATTASAGSSSGVSKMLAMGKKSKAAERARAGASTVGKGSTPNDIIGRLSAL